MLRPSQPPECLPEGCKPFFQFWIALREGYHDSNPARILCSRCDRQRRRSTAEQRDELAPLDHSITSSARASTLAGTSRPSALAVLRLSTVSYLVGACTG